MVYWTKRHALFSYSGSFQSHNQGLTWIVETDGILFLNLKISILMHLRNGDVEFDKNQMKL